MLSRRASVNNKYNQNGKQNADTNRFKFTLLGENRIEQLELIITLLLFVILGK